MNIQRITAKPWEFLVVFLVVFFLASVFLFVIDFVPEPVITDASSGTEQNVLATEVQYPLEKPVRVVVKKIGLDTTIENPDTADATTLDSALLKGAVRYPDSALLGQNATVYLFAHQSYLPVVKNQAFKAFNGIQKLDTGDEIMLYSDTALYTYRVSVVELVDAEEALISLDSGSRTLTLSTCNSFGEKSERFVVTADFVSRTAITN